VVCFNDLKPFLLGFDSVLGKTVIEEDFEGGFFAIVVVRVVGDEPNETTWGRVSKRRFDIGEDCRAMG
jgi:hypothetical protein